MKEDRKTTIALLRHLGLNITSPKSQKVFAADYVDEVAMFVDAVHHAGR